MDIITLGYYGFICGVLGYSAPKIGNKYTRIIAGVCTGLVGAAMLPLVRGLFVGDGY